MGKYERIYEKMREILFSGKRIDNYKWEEGFYVKCRGHHYILPQYDIDHGFDERYSDWIEVSEKTVCQYTGLIDKNGRKIFGGDIVRYVDEIMGKEKVDEVMYNETNAAFCRLHKSKMGLQYLFIDEAVANECEVIGNIFDNFEQIGMEGGTGIS